MGTLPGWQERFVNAHPASHPWEDWAETWAHYLQIVDTLETAGFFGMGVRPGNKGPRPPTQLTGAGQSSRPCSSAFLLYLQSVQPKPQGRPAGP